MDNDYKNLLLSPADRPKVLVVDDAPANLRLVGEILKDDYEVFVALSGEQALAQCLALSPDLVLLDVQMPGMDGYEVCKRLKGDPRTRDISVVFLTGQDDQHDEAVGFELGAADYITKPFHAVVLRARVRTHTALKLQTDLLRSIALVDGLTGVANRRLFDESLQTHWLQAARAKKELSLILLDVDYFKLYNDTYGHPAGDACLRTVAQCIRAELRRPYDLPARYGGEEFACLLPDTDLKSAIGIADNILQAIKASQLPHARSDVAPFVTASLGVASMSPQPGSSFQALIDSADSNLYQAKYTGRMRVFA